MADLDINKNQDYTDALRRELVRLYEQLNEEGRKRISRELDRLLILRELEGGAIS
jgi:hypothetical protein